MSIDTRSDSKMTSQRPFTPPVSIRNPINRALGWFSKSDPNLLAVCSRWAMATQVAFGVFVLFTAALAFGSAYYTLSTLGAPSSLVPWIAGGWSMFILFLDREIAGSLDKTSAVLRPFLALFIGSLVAIPIELWVFQQRIDQELQKQYRQDNKQELDALHANEAKLDQRRADLQATLTELRKEETTWGQILDSEAVGRSGPGRTGVAGAGPVFQNAQAQQASVRQRIEEVRRDLVLMDSSLPGERQRMEGQFHREKIGKITDFVTRYEAMDKVIHSSTPLYRLSWLITLAMILVECCPAVLKIFTPHVDYHHLVRAEIRENIARIDEISDRNYRLAIENPELPEPSVAEKFAFARFGGTRVRSASGRFTKVQDRSQRVGATPEKHHQPIPVPKAEYDQSYLDTLCDSVFHHFGGIPRPIVSIKPANAFDKANAHCISPHNIEEPCAIEFNRDYLRSASPQEIENTMKHELIHAWIHFKGITDSATHGHVFIMKAREVGCAVERFERELDKKRTRATGAGAG